MHQLTGKKVKIITYLILLFILSTTSGKFSSNQNTYSSKIKKINVEGLSNTENLKISNELSDLIQNDIFFIDKKKVNNIMTKHNVIEEYTIKKIYPSTISIKIKPTKYLAKMSNDHQLIVGANGKLIVDKKNKEILPFIFGEFKSENFLSLKKNIYQSKFTFKEFKTLYFFQSNRWDVLTHDNILIKLPQNNFLESLNLAYKIINSNKFLKKDIIDLRVKNHLIVK
ncbi:MAG: FtsQ-type POTRA domain-containing protein [Flavobacteriaceae bacterium TMED238]|jgi:cell division protein FtsQ|nr:MAG: FtsQ-type POTRA domain-containing protein [Flavobacteriaceae bacterium TMED238]|tara:strand:+ start:269 stop:946 length:678 start_codon:yes stop_codon:yes gene_type:complete